MVAVFGCIRKLAGLATALAVTIALAACQPVTSVGGGPRIDATRSVEVALLVPRTGSGAALGGSLEAAARLAVSDLQGVTVDLSVYDTQSTPEGASAAATQAARDGAKIVLGPLFADTSAAAGAAVAGRGLNVLSFSNNPAIAGGNLFILGPTFNDSANRLAGFARARGISSAAIVHGDSDAERVGRDAVAGALARNGLALTVAAPFPLSQQGILEAMPSIGDRVTGAGSGAVFLTSGADGALPFLSELLPEAGVDPALVQYIGLQRLDGTASALTLSGLQGAWFALPDPAVSTGFAARYTSVYGGRPSAVSGLAYDAVSAVGALIATGQSDALTGASLTRGQGFVGANGVFRLLPNGTNQRGLAVATIQNNQVVILDPAPRSFGGAGF